MDGSQGLLFGDAVPVGYAEPVDPARRIMLSSESQDWCTPPEVLDVVRTFGEIAFDPFSNPFSLVGAARSVAPPDDSLVIDWPLEGLSWCNTPYGEALAACAAKIAQQARRGCEILTLVPARTDTAWWHSLNAPVWCAWKGRITFLETIEAALQRHGERVRKAQLANQRPPKAPRLEKVSEHLVRGETATFASALCYHGPRPAQFVATFEKHGKVYGELHRVWR